MMSFTRPYRIVVIDDDQEILNIVKNYLSKFSDDDISLSVFTDSQEALTFAAEHQVHIVITDLHLKLSSGTDVITKCLKLEKGIQIIALSADEAILPAIECFNRGAKSILLKPLRKEELINVISNCIEFLNSWHDILSIRMHKKDIQK